MRQSLGLHQHGLGLLPARGLQPQPLLGRVHLIGARRHHQILAGGCQKMYGGLECNRRGRGDGIRGGETGEGSPQCDRRHHEDDTKSAE